MLNKLSYILTLTKVRLVSSTNSLSSGRVEVFYNGNGNGNGFPLLITDLRFFHNPFL